MTNRHADKTQCGIDASRKWTSLARTALTVVIVVVVLAACTSSSDRRAAELQLLQQQRAIAMWQERCKKSGEFIHKTVEGVEGVYLVNVRMRTNMGESEQDQFALDDPYGDDMEGDGYVTSFLKNELRSRNARTAPDGTVFYPGFRFVEAQDPGDGKLYRFTGRIEEPWQQNKSYLKGYTQFVLDRVPIDKRTARYGVRFEDISTREEREHWIAGSSLKVIDLQTQQVIGERVGYMVDWAQGSRGGGRKPWLLATDNACPAFSERRTGPRVGSIKQLGQTFKFVEKVIKPLP